MTDVNETRFQRRLKKIADHRFLSIAMLIGVAISGLAIFSDNVSKLLEVFKPDRDISAYLILSTSTLNDSALASALGSESSDSVLFAYTGSMTNGILVVEPSFDSYVANLSNPDRELAYEGALALYDYIALPQLEVRVYNPSGSPEYVRSIRLEGITSRPISQPFLMLSGNEGLLCLGLHIENAGTPVDSMRFKFNVVRATTPIEELDFTDLPYVQPMLVRDSTETQLIFIGMEEFLLGMAQDGTFPDSISNEAHDILAHLNDLETYDPALHVRSQEVFHQMGFSDPRYPWDSTEQYQIHTLVYGFVEYWLNGTFQSIRVAKRVQEFRDCSYGGPLEWDMPYLMNAMLDSALNRQIVIPAPRPVPAGELARFELTLAGKKPSEFDFDVYVDLESGKMLHAGRVHLRYFLPLTDLVNVEVSRSENRLPLLRLWTY